MNVFKVSGLIILFCMSVFVTGCDSVSHESSNSESYEEESAVDRRELVSHSSANQTCIPQAWGGHEIGIAIDIANTQSVKVKITSVSSGATHELPFEPDYTTLPGENCELLVFMETNGSSGQEDLDREVNQKPRPILEEGKLYQITIERGEGALKKIDTFSYMNCSTTPASCPNYVVSGGNAHQDFAFIIDSEFELHSIPFAQGAGTDFDFLPPDEGVEMHWTHGTKTWQIPTSVRSVCQDLGLSVQKTFDCEKEMGKLAYFLAPGAYTQVPTRVDFPSPTWLGGYPVGVNEFSGSETVTAEEFCQTVNFSDIEDWSSFSSTNTHVHWTSNAWSTNVDWTAGDLSVVKHFNSIECI